jgi:hypothetical protein
MGGQPMASVSNVNLGTRGFMRASAPESASRYLSMALASRKLMNRLDSFALTGELNEPMVEALKNLLSIMNTDWQATNSFAPVPGNSPFGRYEQALIVNQVAEPFDSRKILRMLTSILTRTTESADRGATVRDINEFLYVLENRALHKYSEHSYEREW